MRKSPFTDSQIIAVLKQAEAGVKVLELCRERGVEGNLGCPPTTDNNFDPPGWPSGHK